MTYIKPAALDFFERFSELHIANHTKDIDSCNLVSTSDGVALELPGRMPQWLRISTTFDISKNAKLIVEAAKARLTQISLDDTADKIRSIRACQAASRTCLFIDRIVMRSFTPELKGLHDELFELGRTFLQQEAKRRSISCVKAACENDTLRAALYFIRQGEQITEAEGYYQPLLALACADGDDKIACDLITLGAAPDAASKSKLLFYALEEKKEELALKLVELGADLHAQKLGKTPLHIAAEAGFLAVVEKMLEKKVNSSSLDLDCSTSLHLACQKLHADVALALIHAGTNVAQINLQIDPASNAKRQGACALVLAQSAPGDTLTFFRKLLPGYAIPDEGMQAYLNDCKEKPEKLLQEHGEHNPFELALLFQDSELAQKLAEKMTLSQFYEYFEALKVKYPTCSLDIIEFCFLNLSSEHLQEELQPFMIRAPTKEVSLEEILTYDRSQEITLRRVLATIQNRAAIPGLLNTDTAKLKFYELLETCLKNCIISLQSRSDTEKEEFLRLITSLDGGEVSSGKYFDTITKAYRTICSEKPKTFEEEIIMFLAELRERLLRAIVKLTDDYNEALHHLGEELAIPGHDARSLYKATKGQCDLKAVKEKFFRLYTPQTIVRDCLINHFEHTPQRKEQFLSWMENKIPQEWGAEVHNNFGTISAKSEEEKREFLKRNGVVVEPDKLNFEEAIEKRRRQVYREQELLDDQGKVKELGVIRMLASLEKPVFSSTKLAYENAPSTFTTDQWLLDMIDMV